MKNLSNRTRQGVVEFILKCMIKEKIPHGTFRRVAREFNCSHWAITRIWKLHNANNSISNPLGGGVSSKIKKKAVEKATTLRN